MSKPIFKVTEAEAVRITGRSAAELRQICPPIFGSRNHQIFYFVRDLEAIRRGEPAGFRYGPPIRAFHD
jgi:hypothetical protein